jgi:hypothetical protein
MTDTQYKAFLERISKDAHPCKYGHTQCSDRQGGRCSDEESQYHNEEDG